jgi:hypothetical protein
MDEKPKPLHWWVWKLGGYFKCSICGLELMLSDDETLPMGDEPDEEPCIETEEDETP